MRSWLPGPVATKKYHAVLATVAEQEALDVADAALDFAKATARALEKELDSLRSIKGVDPHDVWHFGV